MLLIELNHIKMDKKTALEILKWQYYPPYNFYNNDLTVETMAEMMNGFHYAIFNNSEELIGFFCIGQSAQVPVGHQYGAYEKDFIDMGLGIDPQLVGQGYGFEFCSSILKWINQYSPNAPIRLTVAIFNERAINLYRKLGFQQVDAFRTDLSDFITMVKNN